VVIYIEIKLKRDTCLKRYNEFLSDNVEVYRVTVALSSHKEHPCYHWFGEINQSFCLRYRPHEPTSALQTFRRRTARGGNGAGKSARHKLNYSGPVVGNQLCRPFRWKRPVRLVR